MRTLKTNFRYCYGIKKLEKEFDFSNRTFAVYAANATMKTSFAKTFDDYANDRDTTDLAFPDRKTLREIKSDGKNIDPKSIFVVEPYNEDYRSEKISTLLANKELKKNYETIHKDIDKTKTDLVKKLKQLSGLTGRKDSIEDVIENVFGENFFDFIVEIEEFVLENKSLPFHDVQYQMVFNDKVIGFLNTKDFKTSIKEYIEKYNELIEKSKYLKKEFNFYHAENIQKQLEINNFFKVGHSVNLFDGKNKKEYSSGKELKELLENEKKNVLDNKDLQKRFEDYHHGTLAPGTATGEFGAG